MEINQGLEKCFKYCFLERDNVAVDSVFSEYRKMMGNDFIHHFPIQVLWKLTSACNLRCKHCFYYTDCDKFSTKDDLSKEEIFEFARYLVEEVNILSVVFTGGEAFLAPFIFELIEYFKSKNVCVSILSNGTLIDINISKKLAVLLNPKYDGVQISLDGPCASIHDAIRGNGNFEKSIKALGYLSENNISTTISSTITSESVMQLYKYAELYKNFNIRELVLNRYKVVSKEQAYLEPKLENLFINVAKLIDLGIPFRKTLFQAYDFLNFEYGKLLFDNNELIKKYGDNKLCHNHNKMFVAADGSIYLCTSCESANISLGNIREKSFEDIWNNRFDCLAFKPRCIEACINCKYKYWCDGGCAVMSYIENSDANTPPKNCSYWRN